MVYSDDDTSQRVDIVNNGTVANNFNVEPNGETSAARCDSSSDGVVAADVLFKRPRNPTPDSANIGNNRWNRTPTPTSPQYQQQQQQRQQQQQMHHHSLDNSRTHSKQQNNVVEQSLEYENKYNKNQHVDEVNGSVGSDGEDPSPAVDSACALSGEEEDDSEYSSYGTSGSEPGSDGEEFQFFEQPAGGGLSRDVSLSDLLRDNMVAVDRVVEYDEDRNVSDCCVIC